MRNGSTSQSDPSPRKKRGAQDDRKGNHPLGKEANGQLTIATSSILLFLRRGDVPVILNEVPALLPGRSEGSDCHVVRRFPSGRSEACSERRRTESDCLVVPMAVDRLVSQILQSSRFERQSGLLQDDREGDCTLGKEANGQLTIATSSIPLCLRSWISRIHQAPVSIE
jgi:hypothetical protein